MKSSQYKYILQKIAALANITLTSEQLAEIASQIDISTKVDKVTGKSLVLDTEITKLAGVAASANNYTHPANHAPSVITQDASNRFVTDTEKSTWNGKQDAMGSDDNYVTDAEKSNLHAPGSDNQDLSGKQDTLVSATNIKTINGATVLGSGDLVVGGGGFNTLKKTADQTINAGAGVFTDITGLTFPVVSGVDYAFHFYITFQSSAATTGWKAGVNCPTGVLDFWAQSQIIANGAAGVATHTERHNVTRDDMTLLTATVTQAVDLAVRIEGRYKCTQNGTFAARFANELAANTNIVVQKGSWGYWF